MKRYQICAIPRFCGIQDIKISSTFVEIKVSKLNNSWLFKRQVIKTSSTIVKVKVLKLSNSKAFWKTMYQNFFNLGEGKGVKTKQF